jgi:hypothetical protein
MERNIILCHIEFIGKVKWLFRDPVSDTKKLEIALTAWYICYLKPAFKKLVYIQQVEKPEIILYKNKEFKYLVIWGDLEGFTVCDQLTHPWPSLLELQGFQLQRNKLLKLF